MGTCESILQLHNLDHEHLAMVKVKEGRILQGSVQVVHNINTTTFEEAITRWETAIFNESSTTAQLTHTKIEQIRKGLLQIQPMCHRERRKRWDKLGSSWKWLAGSPDAGDLQNITNSINDVVDNNNKQILINKNFDDTLIDMIRKIKELAAAGSSDTDDLYSEIRLLKINFDLEILEKEIEHILDSLLLSKLKMINSNLLSSQEIEKISNYVKSQNLTFESISQALSYAETSVKCDEEMIVYVIDLLTVSQVSYDLLRIEAIPRNAEKISLPGKYFLRSTNTTLVLLDNCQDVNQLKICRKSEVKELPPDDCLPVLLHGHSSHCDYEKSVPITKVIEMTDHTVLVANMNDTITNTCGAANRTIKGTYLIDYRNCSIHINGQWFNNEIIGEYHQVLLPPTNGLNITKKAITHRVDLEFLHHHHLENLKTLSHLEQSIQKTRFSFLGLSGGLSFTTICLITFAIIVLRKLQPIRLIQDLRKLSPQPTPIHQANIS